MATSPLQSEKKRQDAAYARAQDAIATARASGASDLTLSGDDFSDLAVLPPDIGSLTALSSLDRFEQTYPEGHAGQRYLGFVWLDRFERP